jgi:probable lipoprotein (TIGR04455 family)
MVRVTNPRAALLVALAALACARVVPYARSGYAGDKKRIEAAAWGPTGPLLAKMALDWLRLKSNYIVLDSAGIARTWAERCERAEAVLEVRVLNEAPLQLRTELFDCGSGALLWAATASSQVAPGDDDLIELTRAYAQEFGPEAQGLVAPAFLALRSALRELPAPTLSVDEVLEKIEIDAGS